MERLRSHGDFIAVLKGRRKVASKDIVVHYQVHDASEEIGYAEGAGRAAVPRKVGLAVSKAVGNAVIRNTVKRRFRVLAKAHEELLPMHCAVVIRAKPSAARVSFRSLDAQVIRCFADIQQRYRRGFTSQESR